MSTFVNFLPSFRLARTHDIESLLLIEKLTFSSHHYRLLSTADYNHFLSTNNASVWVVEMEKTPCASMILSHKTHAVFAQIESLVVRPKCQKKGLELLLIQLAEKFLVDHGIYKLNLSVRSDNIRLIERYKRHGFKIDQKIHCFYPDNEACFRLIKQLPQSKRGFSRGSPALP